MRSYIKISSSAKLLERRPKCKHVQDVVTLNICVRLYQNQSINKGTKVMTTFLSENNNCDFDPKMLECKCVQCVQDIVICYFCMKLYQNQIISKAARTTTKM